MPTLKELTQLAHDRIETTPFSKELFNGSLAQTAWGLFLYQKLLYIREIEKRISLPKNLRRAESLLNDSNGVYPIIVKPTELYINKLQTVDEHLLDAHIYVNYMGDLYGGQILKKTAPGRSRHLDFNDRVKLIEWIRSRIVGRDELLAAEASDAFGYVENIQDYVFNLTQDSIRHD